MLDCGRRNALQAEGMGGVKRYADYTHTAGRRRKRCFKHRKDLTELAGNANTATSAINAGYATNAGSAQAAEKIKQYSFGAAPEITESYQRFYVGDKVAVNTSLIPIAGKHGGSVLPYQFSFDEAGFIRTYPIGHPYKAERIICVLAN